MDAAGCERPARVLMLNYEYPPLGGGSATATRYLLRELVRDGTVEVDLVTAGLDEAGGFEEAHRGARVLRIPVGKIVRYYWTPRELARWTARALRASSSLLRRDRYDLIHAWSGWPSGVVASLLRPRRPFLVALRGSDVPGYNPRLRRLDPFVFGAVSRAVWRRASAVTCLTHYQLAQARRTLPELRAEVIPNGVDSARFRPGEPAERFRVLFVGRLIERKAVDDVIAAVAELRAAGVEAELRVVGDGPERPRLEALARERGLGDRTRFLGHVEFERLPEVYASASVFVSPALDEALGNAVLEALASGLPVVTTDTGAAELLEGGGVVVGRRRVDQIRDALLAYARDPERRRAHAARARHAAERCDWAETAAAYHGLYVQMLEGSGVARAGTAAAERRRAAW